VLSLVAYWHFLEASVIWELLERNTVCSLP